MSRHKIAMVWANWANTSEGRRCTDFSTLQNTGVSPENRFYDRLWTAFKASAKLLPSRGRSAQTVAKTESDF